MNIDTLNVQGVGKYTEKIIDLLIVYGPKVLLALIVLIIGLFIINRMTGVIGNILGKRHTDTTLTRFIVNMIGIVFKTLLIISVAQMVGIETTSFVAVMAAASLAIGMALQGSLGNFAGGALILFFRPYKIGTNIPESMFVPTDAPLDVYNTTFIYKKDGVEKEFTLENYPKNDSTWTFVDQKTVLVSTGYKAPIHDFSIVDANYNDITEDVIYDKGYTYLLVMYDINKASKAGAKQAEIIYNKYKNSSTKFYALTASSDDDIHEFVKRTGVTFPFCKTDPITLKTIVRANPGLVLIKNGVIMNKWHWRDF